MKLRAQITIDLSADSYAEAAAHQLVIEKSLAALQKAYPDAVLQLRERRERKPAGEHAYDDAEVLPMAVGWHKR